MPIILKLNRPDVMNAPGDGAAIQTVRADTRAPAIQRRVT